MNRQEWRFSLWAGFILLMVYGIWNVDWIAILVGICIGFLGFITARSRQKLSKQEAEPKFDPGNKY